MSNKTSVIFLKDWSILVKSLSDENQIIFWDLFMNYDPEENNFCKVESVAPVWNFIKMQLEKMDNKYKKNVVARNKENGKKGGRPKKIIENQPITKTQQNPKNPMGFYETQKTLNENENVNDNVNENKNIIKKNIFNFRKSLIELGFDKKLVEDWLKVRKMKKASNTETAFNQIKNQVESTDLNIDEVLTMHVVRSWSGFKISWYLNEIKSKTQEKPKNATDELKNRLLQLGIPTIK